MRKKNPNKPVLLTRTYQIPELLIQRIEKLNESIGYYNISNVVREALTKGVIQMEQDIENSKPQNESKVDILTFN